MSKKMVSWGTLILVAVCAISVQTQGRQPISIHQDETIQPVEEEMHDFMEYLFQPPYRRLKREMARPRLNSSSWRVLRSESLILAEGCNLLLTRLPEEEQAHWKKLSAQTREHGKKLYHAAHRKDADDANKSYRAMLDSCNQCHKDFADGEYQLDY